MCLIWSVSIQFNLTSITTSQGQLLLSGISLNRLQADGRASKLLWLFLVRIWPHQRMDPGFLRRRVPIPKGVSVYYLTIFSENCMKMKNFCLERGASLLYPLNLPLLTEKESKKLSLCILKCSVSNYFFSNPHPYVEARDPWIFSVFCNRPALLRRVCNTSVIRLL